MMYAMPELPMSGTEFPECGLAQVVSRSLERPGSVEPRLLYLCV